MPNTCADAGGRNTSAGVRAKKSGRVSAASGANTPARPNSASHSSRCQRCTGSLTPATSAPRRQTSSISGREYAYSSNSCAIADASCARRLSSGLPVVVVAVGRVFAQVTAYRRQIARRQARGLMEQRQQLALDRVAVDDAQRRRRCARDVAQEAAQEARLDVGGDAQPARQRLLDDALDERIRHHQGHGVEQRRLRRRDVLGERVEQRFETVRVGEPDHADGSLPQPVLARNMN